ncbi:MAG: hypothetical protein D6693_05110 [Planctomycetota bacterium]|nr:MAG: hypothetical protein D6693_05110 [Planctomycetota bacterium]
MPVGRTTHAQTDPALEPRAVLCPYCGGPAGGGRCRSCGGLFDPLSIQATQNSMGPWFVRDAAQPFRPGCSYETLARLISRGRVTGESVIRGPTTRQFWSFARNVRGVSHLVGECYACHGSAAPEEYMCRSCGAVFEPVRDRQYFGAGAVRLLPGQAPPEVVVRSVRGASAPASAGPAAPVKPATDEARALRNALNRAKRQMERSRRLMTVSVAVNVVLLAAVLAAALTPRLSGGRWSTASAPAPSDAEPAPVSVSAPANDPESEAAVTRAERLLAEDTFESLREADRLLTDLIERAGADVAGADRARALLRRVRARLDAKSLEGLAGGPQSP